MYRMQRWAETYGAPRRARGRKVGRGEESRAHGDVAAYARRYTKGSARASAAREGQRDTTFGRSHAASWNWSRPVFLTDRRPARGRDGYRSEEHVVAELRRAYDRVEPRDLSRLKDRARQRHTANGHADPSPLRLRPASLS